MSRFKLTLVFLVFAFSFNAFSQESIQNKKVWSLEECINYAIRNSLTVQQAQLNLESSKAYYDQSKAAFLPSINAGANHYINFGRAIDQSTNAFVKDKKIQTGNLQLSGSFLLFGGLQNQWALKQYRSQFEASLASIEQAKYDISLNVASYYLDILLNYELLQSTKIQLGSSEEQLNRTQKLVKAGSLPESNYLDVKAQRASEEVNVVNAENQFELSKLTLLQALLLPANSDFEVVVPNIPNLDSVTNVQRPDDIYTTALATQPSIKSVDQRIKSAKYGEFMSTSGRYPSLSLGGGVSSNYSSEVADLTPPNDVPYFDQIRENRGEYVSLNLRIPIFNNYTTKTRIQNSIIARKRTELEAIEIKNNLRQSVEQAYLNVKASSKRYFALMNQVEALRESFRVNEQRFNVGVVNSLDFTLAKNNLNKAESDFVRAKYEYIFRLKVLDFYMNKPLTLN